MQTVLLLLLSICQATFSLPAQGGDLQLPAGDAASVWINPGFRSYHFDRSKNFREDNYGLGVQVNLSSTNSIIGGEFQNSDDARSHYLCWIWQPYRVGIARFGLWAGGLDGYPDIQNGGWFLAAFPIVSLEYKAVGINFTILPDQQDATRSALVMQFRLRLWEQ